MHTLLCSRLLLCPLLRGMHKHKAVASLRGRAEKSHHTHTILKTGKGKSYFFICFLLFIYLFLLLSQALSSFWVSQFKLESVARDPLLTKQTPLQESSCL